MNEKSLIQGILSQFNRSGQQRNKPFESDAELVEIGGELVALTIDEFSQDADEFFQGDYEQLGWNLAVGAISDIIATGASPSFLLQSMVLPTDMLDFGSKISAGIAKVMDQCGCFVVGGDIGYSAGWRYAASVIGRFGGKDPITRILPERKQLLWVTGKLGDANLSSIDGTYPLALELRSLEFGRISSVVNGCIDTSEGLIGTLWTMRELNPWVAFCIDPSLIPYDEGVLSYSKKSGIPKEAALLGASGEYELVFATNEGFDTEYATCIGHIEPSCRHRLLFGDFEVESEPMGVTSFDSLDEYVAYIVGQSRLYAPQ